MDRFIGRSDELAACPASVLKSNMDRFIGRSDELAACPASVLKSNMDRFIARFCERNPHRKLAFKIQYG